LWVARIGVGSTSPCEAYVHPKKDEPCRENRAIDAKDVADPVPIANARAPVKRANDDALRPVRTFVPDWSNRRIAENARAGRIPGARKIGKQWMMARSDFERWIGLRTTETGSPSVEDAAADLQRRGVI
jgi:hypothetical protein